MSNLNKIAKLFLFISVVLFTVWFGGNLTRSFAFFQLIDPETQSIKQNFLKLSSESIFAVYKVTAALIDIIFILFIVSYLVFIINSRIKLKEEGWLFITTIIIVVTAPFEIYLISFDYKFIINHIYSLLSSEAGFILIKNRLLSLGSFPLIEILSYFAIIFLWIYKPFSMSSGEDKRKRI